jgi:thiol-disulfide isomerase/thioredoxin
MKRFVLCGVFLANISGCRSEPSSPPAVSSPTVLSSAPSATPPNTTVVVTPTPSAAGSGATEAIPAIRMFEATEQGDLFATIRASRLRAVEGKRVLVVYVGASWCPPCKRFHEAIRNHSLDEKLAGFDFLYLDMDVVKDKIVETGYASKYIPFFALPTGDGKRGDSFEIKRTDAKAQDELLEKLAAWRPKK